MPRLAEAFRELISLSFPLFYSMASLALVFHLSELGEVVFREGVGQLTFQHLLESDLSAHLRRSERQRKASQSNAGKFLIPEKKPLLIRKDALQKESILLGKMGKWEGKIDEGGRILPSEYTAEVRSEARRRES